MTLDIWFGQFNTVGGAVHEEGPYIGIFEGGMDEPNGVGVYVLVEPCGGAGADLCGYTIEAVARGFGDPGQALTASLLRALNAAHAYVRRHHPGEAAPEFGVGISILAVRGAEAYVAQAGPALACVRSGGVVRVVEPLGDSAAQPLGAGPRMTPSFARFQLAPGDSAILLFGSGAQLVGQGRLSQLVAQAPEHALPDLYLRSRGAADFAVLYLAVTGERGVGSRQSAVGSRQPALGQATLASRAERARGGAEAALTTMDAGAGAGANGPSAADDDQRNGHGPLNGVVRTIATRRTSLGSMSSGPSPITRRRVVMAGAAVGVGALLLMALPNLARQGKSEKFTQLVRGADEAISAAERETDPARRRALLARAQSTMDEARTLNSRPGELSGLEQRLADQLAQVNDVHQLSDLQQIADLAAPGLAAPAANEIAVGPLVYALDATAGKVMGLPREGDAKPLTVFEEGRPAGQNKTGRARHITWWPAQGSRAAALLVLDDQRRLYAVDERGDIRPVALGETGDWKSDTSIAVGANELYVLDAGNNQVWRYAAGAGGFPGAPEALLGPRVSLKDAVAISVVGGPVVSTSDARLLRIADGREQVLAPQAMDRPLLAPSPPLSNVADGLLYIADRGNQRIVRLGQDGTFRGQLTHHRLAGLRAIALDESTNTLYAIAGQTLVKASVPK